jgi:hypothetical protein
MPSRPSTDRSPARSPGRGPLGAPRPRALRPGGGAHTVRRDVLGGAPAPRIRREPAPHGLPPRRLAAPGEHPARPGDDGPSPVTVASGTSSATVAGRPAAAGPVDGVFRTVRSGGAVRRVRTRGKPVPGADDGAASARAVPRDAGEPRHDRPALRGTRDSSQRHRHRARTGHRLAAEPRGTCRRSTAPRGSRTGAVRHSPRPTAAPRPGALPRHCSATGRGGRPALRRRPVRRRPGAFRGQAEEPSGRAARPRRTPANRCPGTGDPRSDGAGGTGRRAPPARPDLVLRPGTRRTGARADDHAEVRRARMPQGARTPGMPSAGRPPGDVVAAGATPVRSRRSLPSWAGPAGSPPAVR